MKEKFYRFMQGRYGMDAFSKFLMIVGVILYFISSLIPKISLTLIPLIIVIYAYYRIFSKEHQRRYKENQWFLLQKSRFLYHVDRFKNRKHITDPNHIFKCPKCKQKLRIPKGRGKIQITCKKCQHQFIKKS